MKTFLNSSIQGFSLILLIFASSTSLLFSQAEGELFQSQMKIYNKALEHAKAARLDSAELYFVKFIESTDQKDEILSLHGMVDSAKKLSYIKLGEIYHTQNSYKESNKYLLASSKQENFSILKNLTPSPNTKVLVAKNYLKLNDDALALEQLLPLIIPNRKMHNNEVAPLAYNTLLKKYDKEFLQKEFEQSIKDWYKKPQGDQKERYFIRFLDTEIYTHKILPSNLTPTEVENYVLRTIRNTEFYKLLFAE